MEKQNKLVWIDLEMTGLNPDKDLIIEIATLITDNELNIIANGPNLIIHQSQEVLDSMDEWNTTHHKLSGLTEQVKASTISIKEAERQTLDFIKQYSKIYKSPLCGNSIYQDRAFLRRYMPKINNYLSYRLIDVSTIKELVKRWYPNSPYKEFEKKECHRALQDIYASIAELKHYQKCFFINK